MYLFLVLFWSCNDLDFVYCVVLAQFLAVIFISINISIVAIIIMNRENGLKFKRVIEVCSQLKHSILLFYWYLGVTNGPIPQHSGLYSLIT